MKQANFPLLQMHNYLVRRATAELDDVKIATDVRLKKQLAVIKRMSQDVDKQRTARTVAGQHLPGVDDQPYSIEIPPTTFLRSWKISGGQALECHGCVITTKFPNNFAIVKTPKGDRKVLVVDEVKFDEENQPILAGRTFLQMESIYKMRGLFDFGDEDCYKVTQLSRVPSEWDLSESLVGKGFPVDLSVDATKPLAPGEKRPTPIVEEGEWIVQKMMHFLE